MPVKLNSKGTNANIKANILSDDDMRNIGFTDCVKGKWYLYKHLDNSISFNVTIPKDGSDIEIITLDEEFCQPYDYQSILERHPELEFALKIKELAEKWMRYLVDNGVLSGWTEGDYI